MFKPRHFYDNKIVILKMIQILFIIEYYLLIVCKYKWTRQFDSELILNK